MHDLGVFLGTALDPDQLAHWDHVPIPLLAPGTCCPHGAFPPPNWTLSLRSSEPPAHDEPVLIEAILLRDADILEQLGASAHCEHWLNRSRYRYPTFSSVLPFSAAPWISYLASCV